MLSVDYWIICLVAIGTILIVLLTFMYVKDLKIRLAIVLSAASIFLYSGYGISLSEVDNKYVYKYIFALLFFYLPFILVSRRGNNIKPASCKMEKYIEQRSGFLKASTYIYFLLIIIPLLFPKFRLFNVFTSGITIVGIYDYLNSSAANPFSRFITTLALFLRPFFYAYLTYLRIKEPRSPKPLILFLLDVCIYIMDMCYIGRSAMVNKGLLLFFLIFCIKNGEFRITKKQIIVLLAIGVASVPFMYEYTFIRAGIDAKEVSFGDSINLLLSSEVSYPMHYDYILSSSVLQGLSPFTVILWLIFLPIPSFLWHNKPTLANDLFTYSITGLHRTDYGYYSLLPSFLGESFMYFGGTFYWVYTFMVGLVFALILKYLSNNKYMILFILSLAVRLTAAGRAGATAAIPSFVNGALSVFVLDVFFVKNKKS